ncbi:MAG: hypothetical protein Q8Q31_05910 [Nanoarchaeota archaeon]|nr:hypothetical protein [Nanoarchaeota archaeon]
MEEVEHVIRVLNETQRSLIAGNPLKLRELSNQTIHSASLMQDAGSITLAVIIYTLAKLIERGDNKKIKQWNKFVKRMNSLISLCIISLKEKDFAAYESYLEKIRRSSAAFSPNIRPYIQEVLRKAAINKASRIYEHGISMGQTAKLLGISQWELAEYSGQKSKLHTTEPIPEEVKKRAKMALNFFSEEEK